MSDEHNPAPVTHLVCWELSQDGNQAEQRAFEEWATARGYDMHEHPLHYLFLDPKTDAARQGWRAGLAYARQTNVERSWGDDWTVSDTDTAREILNYLGIGDDASKEPGADRLRDRVAQIIRKRIEKDHMEGEYHGR